MRAMLKTPYRKPSSPSVCRDPIPYTIPYRDLSKAHMRSRERKGSVGARPTALRMHSHVGMKASTHTNINGG